MRKAFIERAGLALGLITLLAAAIGSYANLVEANAQQEVRISTVEQRVEANTKKRDELDQKLDSGINSVNRELQDLKTNTVLICDKLQIDRCK